MKKIFVIIFSFALTIVFAQENKTTVSYEGGNEKMAKDLRGNFESVLKQYNFNGNVNISFVIDENGKIKGEVLEPKSEDNEFKVEIFRALERTGKNWIAATKDGKNVATKVTIPLNYNVDVRPTDERTRFSSDNLNNRALSR
ncbi:energy transducer TonB [Halpernia frigidisoli]|uniref:TonB protein C-terminal n=1 Tax=Halpernia frigidisoli TaxID=1125876 RepID=A0A1I3HSP5_9FLAO|nr:energy transducer TonB [Halpernia frigidisoli]SFI38745.1 TonB protein C-terminal [Halpernia frigidisoli]